MDIDINTRTLPDSPGKRTGIQLSRLSHQSSIAKACLSSVISIVIFAATPLFAQGQNSALSGTVTGPGGMALSDATVRVVSTGTGTDVRMRTSQDGRFTFDNLPEGTYTVSAAMPCCSFQPHTQEDVAIGPGQPVQLDIRLQEMLIVLSDDPALVNATLIARQNMPDAAVPRGPEGKPDLSGVWFWTIDPLQDPPAALPWAEQLHQERIASAFRDHPHNRCLPSAVYAPGAASFMLKLVQTPDLMVILFEDVPGFRQVFLDGRPHPPNVNPTWMGHSVGRWEDDTLVVETVGFNDRGWNWEPYPQTEQMRLEERFTRSEYGSINVEVTINDPGVFEQPWVLHMRLDLAPDEELFEYVCENNKWEPDNED